MLSKFLHWFDICKQIHQTNFITFDCKSISFYSFLVTKLFVYFMLTKYNGIQTEKSRKTVACWPFFKKETYSQVCGIILCTLTKLLDFLVMMFSVRERGLDKSRRINRGNDTEWEHLAWNFQIITHLSNIIKKNNICKIILTTFMTIGALKFLQSYILIDPISLRCTSEIVGYIEFHTWWTYNCQLVMNCISLTVPTLLLPIIHLNLPLNKYYGHSSVHLLLIIIGTSLSSEKRTLIPVVPLFLFKIHQIFFITAIST